ncbi:MAG: hypothetical protein KDD56_09440, partial [Bdellovibrionales bacterium]|nr:hypothetical protein [Bdellovibrionales bacterium]
MQAWSNALVDVASLFMDSGDAGTVGAILDVGVAIAMVYAGDPGARVQNAAYLVSTVTKLVGVTLIKKGPSAQEQMQKALEEIYKSVENLRQEMHKRFNEMHHRFDRLESFLQGVNNRIDTVITQNFFIEKEILKLQLGINNLGILLALVERKLDFYDLAEWKREKDDIASLFKKSYEEASGMFGEFESGPTASYIDVRGHQIDCLTVFREHAISTARRDLFTAQDMVGKEADLFPLFLALNRRGYESSHAILKAAIDTGGILNIQASAFPFNVSNLVSSNPLEFARGALAAVEIPELFWDKNGIFVDKEIQKKTLARIRDEAARIQKYSRAFVIPQVLEAATALYQEQYDAFWKLVESNLNNTQTSISVPREVLFLNGEAELDPLPNWPVDKRESVSDKLNLDYAGRLKDQLKSTRASIISSLFSRYKSQGSDSYNPFYPGHYRPDFHDMILPSANQRLAVPVRAALFHPEIRQAVAFESGPQATALPPHWIKQFGSSNPNCYIVPRGNSDDYLKIGEKETFVGDARFWFETLRSPITYHQDIQYGRMVARVIVTTEPQGFIRTTHTEPFPEEARHLIYNPDGSLKTTDEAELQRVLKADFIRVNSKVIGKEAAIAEFDRLYKKYCDPNEESKTRIFDFYPVVQDAPSNWENYYKHETSEVAAWVNHLIVNLQQNEGENSLKDKEILGYEIRLEDGKPVTFTLEVCEDEKIDLLAYAQAAVSSDSNLDYPSKGEKTEEELKLAWDRFARDIVMKAEADPTNAG